MGDLEVYCKHTKDKRKEIAAMAADNSDDALVLNLQWLLSKTQGACHE